MHVSVVFYNLGGYHLARLDAAAKQCDKEGWRFSAIQLVGATDEHPWGSFTLPSYVSTILTHQLGCRPSLADVRPLVKKLDDLCPDVLAVPGWGFNFSRTCLNWCRRKMKSAILMSESKFDDAPRNWYKEWIKSKFIIPHFAAALVGGRKHEEYLVKLGMIRHKIFRGYDTVDNSYFEKSVWQLRQKGRAQAHEVVGGRRYILAANRFIERKNLRSLIDAFRIAINKTKSEDWDLVLLGDGDLRATLEQKVADYGLSNRVHFPGFVDYWTIPTWYAFADVFVHPAVSEQWGLVVNEAVASGLPVLLSRNCGCYPELLVENESGLSFNPLDIIEISDCICATIRGVEWNPAAIKALATEFSPDKFGQGLVQAVRLCLEK